MIRKNNSASIRTCTSNRKKVIKPLNIGRDGLEVYSLKMLGRIFIRLFVVFALFWGIIFGAGFFFGRKTSRITPGYTENKVQDSFYYTSQFSNENFNHNYKPESAVSLSVINENDSEEAVEGQNPGTEVPNDTSALYDLIGIDASQPFEIILLITLLSVAPSILLMMTCYARIIIVFGFLRNAMQTQSTPPNQVLAGLSLFLTLFIMWPVIAQVNQVAYQPYSSGEITIGQAVVKAGEPIKDFMLRQTSNRDAAFFLNLKKTAVYTPETFGTDNPVESDISDAEINLENYHEQLGFEIVIPAFMLSELTRAFQMGFLLFLPFLVIDLVVSSTLMSMGMMMLPPAMISMPFKIMLFVLVGGWELLIKSIITSYNM